MSFDWHAWRAGGIGASDVVHALGGYGWTPARVVADKVEPEPPPDDYVAAMFAAGHDAEHRLAGHLVSEWGGLIVGEQSCWTDKDHPHRRCTLDGVWLGDGFAPLSDGTIAEFKWVRPKGREKWDQWATQVQYQMLVTGMTSGVVVAEIEGRPQLRAVQADPEYQRRLGALADALWLDVEKLRARRVGA